MTALSLSAIGSLEGKSSITFSADLLVAVVLASKNLERRLDDATTKAEHQVEGRLLLDVVVGERAAVLELLAGEDQALLVRGDALLVLDLRLDVLDGVVALDFERDRFAR